jgi:Ni/Fe-hydrogenase subunit HybB-like protein
MFDKALSGSRKYWAWLTLLVIFIIIGAVFYIRQFNYGLGITGMSRNVSWGLYIANMTFLVGVAASAVMLIIPYYLHNHKDFKRMIALGEFLAVSAVLMALTFVLIDLGQITRMFNLVLHPTPNSILFWDMMVLGGYLLINIIVGWTMLDSERKEEPPPRWVKPLILLSIPWAVSIHTVTAFIYSGLGARPFWETALLAPRFLSSAFASGPALLIILALIIKGFTRFNPGQKALHTLSKIVTYALGITIFFLIVELFTVLYSQAPEEMAHFRYLFFGIDGHTALVPWMWSSVILAVLAFVSLVTGFARKKPWFLAITAAAVVVSMWIDKGLGLIVPGFIPSSTGVVFEYIPTVPEVLISLGVLAMGLFVLSVLYKIFISIETDPAREIETEPARQIETEAEMER